MRILQVITDTDRRGAQVFATDLDDALTALGHDVRTVALAPGQSHTTLAVDVLGSRRLAPATVTRLRGLLKDHDVAVAHGSTTGPACAMAGTSTPFVYRQISDSLFWAPRARDRWRVRRWLNRSVGVVALSTAASVVLREHFGVPDSRLSVIPNGVPRERHRPATEGARLHRREQLGLSPEEFVVAVLAALTPEKGVDLAIDAVAPLSRARLVIAGDGPERVRLEELAKARAPGRVTFLGSVADPSDIYDVADAIVLVSRGGDSMPAALIEAGLRRIPVVATDVGAIAEIVVDGRTGRVVNQTDAAEDVTAALSDLAADPAKAEAMGREAERHCLEQFEIESVAARWEAALVRATGAER